MPAAMSFGLGDAALELTMGAGVGGEAQIADELVEPHAEPVEPIGRGLRGAPARSGTRDRSGAGAGGG
jgi:hypothetical protein